MFRDQSTTMTPRRCLQYIVCWTLLVLPTLISAAPYDRVVAISYILRNKRNFDGLGDDRLFQEFRKVQGNVTAVVPFMLNCDNPSLYDSTLQGLKEMGTIMIPAMGDINHDSFNIDYFRTMAQNYKNYTDFVRLELLEQYMDTQAGLNDIQDFINYLKNTLKFKQVMLNPWPRIKGQGAYPFKNADSNILPVLLNYDRNNPSHINQDPTNWYPPTAERIQDYLDYQPSMRTLINYENQPQMQALASLSIAGQKDAMKTTIDQINSRSAQNLRWAAPWSTNYNPIAPKTNTWDWIAAQLSKWQ